MNTSTPGPRPWKKWQDWTVVLLGAALIATVLVTTPSSSARVTVLVIGSLLMLSGMYSLGTPELRSEYAHMVFGLLLAASPWALGFVHEGVAWSCWVLGAGAVLLGLASLPPAAEPAAHRGSEGQARHVSELTEVRESGGRHHLPDPDAEPAGAAESTERALSAMGSES